MPSSREDQIRQLIEQATQKAFDRGYQAAWAEFQQTLTTATYKAAKGAGATPAKKKKQSGNADAVYDFIKANPGKSGAEIVQGLPNINERTIRTVLRRLRIGRDIFQKDGRWFSPE